MKQKAVILSYYKYDHPFTDMNCAWSTVYNIFLIDACATRTVSVGTGWGQMFEDVAPEIEIVPMTDEIKEKYNNYVKEETEKRTKEELEKFQVQLDEYNAQLRPQKVGQIVEIIKGKHKGKKGKVTWFGNNKFKRHSSYRKQHWLEMAVDYLQNMKPYHVPNAQYDLILVRPSETEKVYVDPDYCKVIEGFETITMTEEDVRRFIESHDDTASKIYLGTKYDETKFV